MEDDCLVENPEIEENISVTEGEPEKKQDALGERQIDTPAEEEAGAEPNEEEESEPEDKEETEDLGLSLESIVEALLVSAGQAKTVKQLAKGAGKGVGSKAVISAINKLNIFYEKTDRSFEIVQIGEVYQIMTKPEYSNFVSNLVKKEEESKKLSPASLDTLAIIAYRQPVMRVDIEHVRGVACGPVLRNLIELGLVKVAGKNTEALGQPMLYGTTERFLKIFGVSSLAELPNIEELQG